MEVLAFLISFNLYDLLPQVPRIFFFHTLNTIYFQDAIVFRAVVGLQHNREEGMDISHVPCPYTCAFPPSSAAPTRIVTGYNQ